MSKTMPEMSEILPELTSPNTPFSIASKLAHMPQLVNPGRWRRTSHNRSPRAGEGDPAALPGRLLAALPGALPAQRAGQGGEEAPQGARQRSEGGGRRPHQGLVDAATGVVKRWSASHPAMARWGEEGIEGTRRASRSPSRTAGASVLPTGWRASMRNSSPGRRWEDLPEP